MLSDATRHASVGPPSAKPEERAIDREERAYYRLNQMAWSLFAPFYDLITRPFRRLRGDVTKIARIGSTARILDVATGTGEQAFSFAEKAAEVVGVDLSEAMLRIAERKNQSRNTTFRRADATALPFPDASFDVACISFALHEMPRSIREKTLREMVRAVRPGGTIVVVDWGLPERAAKRWLVFHGVKLFEGATYVDFIRSDLDGLIAGAGVDVETRATRLGGVAQIVVGRARAG